VRCECGEIAVDGGLDYYKVNARNYENFLRVDDEGNEIVIKVKEKPEIFEEDKSISKPTRDNLLNMLEEMIKSYERLPEHAMLTSVTQADLCSSLILILSILRSERSALI